jgi:hypothetical protein
MVLPSVAPLAAALYRALFVRRWHAHVTRAHHARLSPEVQIGSRKRMCEAELGLEWPHRSSVVGCDVALTSAVCITVSDVKEIEGHVELFRRFARLPP